MANNLTGDYEAVLEVSVRQINGLIASLHQHGAKGSGLSPSFPHSLRNLRVGYTPGYLVPATKRFGEWLGKALTSARASSGASVMGADLAAKAPPGAAVRFRSSLVELEAAAADYAAPGSVFGRAEVQVSTPSISLTPGSTSEVVVSVEIRARFIPDPGSAVLPQPIHGEVQIPYQIQPAVLPDGKRVLKVDPPAQDSRIVYKDLAGLAAGQASALAQRVRTAVRNEFKAEAVELPPDFTFFEFREVGDGKALALPIQLSDALAPAGAIGSVTSLFLDPDATDFALAVGKDYVLAQLQPTLDRLRHLRLPVPIEVLGAELATYEFASTSATLEFKAGFMELKVTGDATHPLWPDVTNIVVTQRLTLSLWFDVIGEPNVSIGALDNPPDLTIENLPTEQARDEARTKIIAERNRALHPDPPAQPLDMLLTGKLRDAIRRLNETMRKVDVFASARYAALDVTPEGVVIRGTIDTSYHYQPQMEIGYTEDGNSFSALGCWIPGGRIANHTWHWVENAVFKTSDGIAWQIPWFGRVKTASDPHRFTLSIPAAIKGQPTWSKSVCLTVDGYQVDRDGRVAAIQGVEKSGTCVVTSHEPILIVDPVWEAIYGVLWGPTPQPDVIIEDRISAHINVLAHPRPASGLGQNALVHFVGRGDGPLPALGRALANMRRPNLSMSVYLVVPVGAFRQGGLEFEETLGLRGERSSDRDAPEHAGHRLFVTEDYGGGWTRTFDARITPASYLMNARGEFVWKQEGRVEPESLTLAMDEHFLEAPAPQGLPMRLSVRPGDRALDPATELRGHALGLGSLRGREVVLNFWQSWSAPCVRELLQLQRLHDEARGRGPVVLAVNGGEEPSVVEEARRRHRLSFTLLADPGQAIARAYDVQCWPTTVSINPGGVVDRVQFGATYARRRDGAAARAS